jgi:hypothetical protein
MNVYEFRVDYEFEALNTEGGLSDANGQVVHKCAATGWEEIDCYVVNPLLKKGAFLKFGSRIVLKPDLRGSSISKILGRFGAFCELSVEGESGFQMWVPTLSLDALDLQNGNKMLVASYEGVAFKKELLQEPTIFRLPNLPGRQFLSSGYAGLEGADFFLMYKESGLKGLEFVPAWEGP